MRRCRLSAAPATAEVSPLMTSTRVPKASWTSCRTSRWIALNSQKKDELLVLSNTTATSGG
jgi:hypothetical protein